MAYLKEDYSEWLSSKILKGDAPDVMMIKDEDFNRFAELEILENLDDYLKRIRNLMLIDIMKLH